MQTLDQRFFSKVHMTSACWVWTAADNGNGYGVFWTGERNTYAHRFSYEAMVAPIPAGLQIDHLCRNRACVRPEHLEPVTCRENLLRGDTRTAREAAQTHCIRGHGFTVANTYRYPGTGKRECRTCNRDRQKARRRQDH